MTPPTIAAMTDLAAFLEARIAEDEERYRELAEFEAKLNEPWRDIDPTVRDATRMFMMRAKPARVLAECEARRALIKQVSDVKWGGYAVRDVVLELMAVPFRDHPDFRPEWAP